MTAIVCALLSGLAFYLSIGLGQDWALAWIAPIPVLWLAFGEAPGALQSVAIMTDSDNTRSRAQAWYGPLTLHAPSVTPGAATAPQ